MGSYCSEITAFVYVLIILTEAQKIVKRFKKIFLREQLKSSDADFKGFPIVQQYRFLPTQTTLLKGRWEHNLHMDTMLKIFQETLQEFFDIYGYKNLLQFANAVKIDYKAIHFWMSGQRFPSVESVKKIADFFDCSTDYLFGLKDTKDYKRGKTNTGFLERYDHLRQEQNLSDYRVAKQCGFRPSVIVKWRHHDSEPKIPKLIKMTEVFNCSLDYLLGRSDSI